jgi:hypothetical protein
VSTRQSTSFGRTNCPADLPCAVIVVNLRDRLSLLPLILARDRLGGRSLSDALCMWPFSISPLFASPPVISSVAGAECGRRRPWPKSVLLAVSASLLIACGCTRNQKQSAPQETSSLKSLAIVYGRYLSTHRGEPPADEAGFKQFVQSLPPEQLAAMKATDTNQLFTSARDHEPYVIVYGKPTGPPGPAGSPVIAYERTGVEGKRFVASSMGAVEEVDEARFKQLVPPAP